MAPRFEDMDWAHIKSFLIVAETGSLTAAAKRIGLSQPTIGRHINALSKKLGAALFTRNAKGLRLTQTGALLLAPAREMANASMRLSGLAEAYESRLSGTVRLTASAVVSHYLLPEIIAEMRIKEPKIEIELVPSDKAERLLFRDSDIAIRMFRPEQLELVTRKLTALPLRLYASHDLLQRYGDPHSAKELLTLPFVGFDKSDLIIKQMHALNIMVDRRFFGTRCNDQPTHWRLVCAGCGIGAMPTLIGDSENAVARIAFQPKLPPIPMWITAKKEVYDNARAKRVWDLIVDRFSGIR